MPSKVLANVVPLTTPLEMTSTLRDNSDSAFTTQSDFPRACNCVQRSGFRLPWGLRTSRVCFLHEWGAHQFHTETATETQWALEKQAAAQRETAGPSARSYNSWGLSGEQGFGTRRRAWVQSPPASAPPSASSSGSLRPSPRAAFSAIAHTRPAARAQESPSPPEPPVSPVQHETPAARGQPGLCPKPGSPTVAAGKAAAPEGMCPA